MPNDFIFNSVYCTSVKRGEKSLYLLCLIQFTIRNPKRVNGNYFVFVNCLFLFLILFYFYFFFREHFHCLDCNSKVFPKKEEMIRHFKWHKKRDESLQHGFMRYSPSDDCSDRFQNCSHNRKQTHYHCIQVSNA